MPLPHLHFAPAQWSIDEADDLGDHISGRVISESALNIGSEYVFTFHDDDRSTVTFVGMIIEDLEQGNYGFMNTQAVKISL
jgi:hypothetical protein